MQRETEREREREREREKERKRWKQRRRKQQYHVLTFFFFSLIFLFCFVGIFLLLSHSCKLRLGETIMIIDCYQFRYGILEKSSVFLFLFLFWTSTATQKCKHLNNNKSWRKKLLINRNDKKMNRTREKESQSWIVLSASKYIVNYDFSVVDCFIMINGSI